MTTACNNTRFVDSIIQKLQTALDERSLSRFIDTPVDRIADQVLAAGYATGSVQDLHEVMAQLVQVITEHALPCRLKLSVDEALAEAIQMLEQGYQSNQGERGYDAAVVDIVTGGAVGALVVLTTLVGIIKHHERQKHKRRVIVECLYSLDPETLAKVAARIHEVRSRFMSSDGPHPAMPYSVDSVVMMIRQELQDNALLQGVIDGLRDPRVA